MTLITIAICKKTTILYMPSRTPPRRTSISRSPPPLRRSARLASRRRSPVSTFPTALRGSPVIDLVSVSVSPKTPKYIRNILNKLKKLENEFPGMEKLWEIREGRLLEFMGELKDKRLTNGEKKALYNELAKMLERLWRGNHLTTKQYQQLVHRP